MSYEWHAPLDPECPEVRKRNEPFLTLHDGHPVKIEATVGDMGPTENGPPEPIFRVRLSDDVGTTIEVPASELEVMDHDPMDDYCGCMDEINDDWERRHRSKCKRCQEYGAENIEVVGP